MSCLLNPASISVPIAPRTRRYSPGVARTVVRSCRTDHTALPRLTSANGRVWICPPSAIDISHRPLGGFASTSSNVRGPALLLCKWMRGPRFGADGWLSGHADGGCAAQMIDHRRSVSGGLPVIAHAHATQSSGEDGMLAWSWSVNVSEMTAACEQHGPAIVSAHQ